MSCMDSIRRSETPIAKSDLLPSRLVSGEHFGSPMEKNNIGDAGRIPLREFFS